MTIWRLLWRRREVDFMNILLDIFIVMMVLLLVSMNIVIIGALINKYIEEKKRRDEWK